MLGIINYKETEATNFNGLPKLEPGGYVIKILNVKAEENQWGQKIALQFDIAEGEHKDFFKKLYNATPDEWENKKWKGSYRISIPQNKGDDKKYKKSVGYFKSQIEAFENSNPNLKINCECEWDENVLKGKLVGALFNEKEWAVNGKSGMFTQCKRLVSANDIRSGNFTIPKPDMLDSTASPVNVSTEIPSDFIEDLSDDGVPF